MKRLIIISILMYSISLFGGTEIGGSGYWYGKLGENGYDSYFVPNKLSYVGYNYDAGKVQFTNVLIYNKEDGSMVFAFSHGDGSKMSKKGKYKVAINGEYDDIPVWLEEPTLVADGYVYFKMNREDAFKIFNDIFSNQKISSGQIEFTLYSRGHEELHIIAPPTNEWRRLFSE